MYDTPGVRVDLWAEVQLSVFTSARVGAYIESTSRAGSGRGLHYRVSVILGRNAEFAMQVVKDAKGMTFLPVSHFQPYFEDAQCLIHGRPCRNHGWLCSIQMPNQ
jgi:hypothetical protein